MIKKFLKFTVTGGLGTVTNLVLFFIFADCLKIQPHVVSFFCFLISCTQNYCINHIWTFRAENSGEKLSLKLWLKFVLGSLVGYAINLAVFSALLHYFDWKMIFYEKEISIKVIPQGIGILCGMIFNFAFSSFIVFRKKSTAQSCDKESQSKEKL